MAGRVPKGGCVMAVKITPPLRLMLDIPAWQAEVLAMPAPALACGALVLLKMHLWRIGPIPDDDTALARITATSSAEWKKLRKSIAPLFVVKYGEWQREDWNDELEAAYEAVNKARQKSQKGNAARWGKHPTGTPTGNPSGIPAAILNNKGTVATRSGKNKAPQPRANDVQPGFETDVVVAEQNLGIGGAV